ncbi:MAG TPA: hypothetical protein VGC80_09655, partial [Acetobacteraceae bacterium]
MMHLVTAALLLPTGSFAAGPVDPCAGGLTPDAIVSCLKPEKAGGATRGIRPARPGLPPEAKAAPSVDLRVPFAFDSADLTPEGTTALSALA